MAGSYARPQIVITSIYFKIHDTVFYMICADVYNKSRKNTSSRGKERTYISTKSDEFEQKLIASLALERLLRGYNYKEANLEQLAELGGVRFTGQRFLVASTFVQQEDMSWSGFGRSGSPSDWICAQLNREIN